MLNLTNMCPLTDVLQKTNSARVHAGTACGTSEIITFGERDP